MIISLDLIHMDLISTLPKKMRQEILQNQFDESRSGAENDLEAMTRISEYFNKRIIDCEKFIEESKKKQGERAQ